MVILFRNSSFWLNICLFSWKIVSFLVKESTTYWKDELLGQKLNFMVIMFIILVKKSSHWLKVELLNKKLVFSGWQFIWSASDPESERPDFVSQRRQKTSTSKLFNTIYLVETITSKIWFIIWVENLLQVVRFFWFRVALTSNQIL